MCIELNKITLTVIYSPLRPAMPRKLSIYNLSLGKKHSVAEASSRDSKGPRVYAQVIILPAAKHVSAHWDSRIGNETQDVRNDGKWPIHRSSVKHFYEPAVVHRNELTSRSHAVSRTGKVAGV